MTVVLTLGFAVVDPGTSSAEPNTGIGISDAVYIEIGDAASRSLPDQIEPPGSATPGFVPTDLVTNIFWTAEVATVPDRTTNAAVNRVTPRTGAMVDAAIRAGLTRLGSVSCVGVRTENPTSDHPAGRGCDLFFNPRSGADVAAGWRTANWLVANQAVLGVKYVIWQGQIWNARTKPGPWTEYVSSAYGCPNPANLTGCHYDHVHVSMY
ncbi:MAG: hypothetical protein ABJA16_06060 [Nakamurella sp.]